jgi:bifunctional ADP-heptose synthase (sugar kinase/adenylyltransferase)
MASGATLGETLELANAAASVVVHKLGTTGTASIAEIRKLIALPGSS